MEIQGYKFKSYEGRLAYDFYSVGPKGRIKKTVMFSPRIAGGALFYNLSFGDWNEVENHIDDRVVTNNQDRQKVLATVAAIVLKFTESNSDIWIYAEGSTPARTRLYQMGIASKLEDIQQLLHVYGRINGKWQPFERGKNYDAFFVLRK